MPGKGRNKMLWKDVFALRSCTLGFLRAQGLACCRTHLLSGLRRSITIPLLSVNARGCAVVRGWLEHISHMGELRIWAGIDCSLRWGLPVSLHWLEDMQISGWGCAKGSPGSEAISAGCYVCHTQDAKPAFLGCSGERQAWHLDLILAFESQPRWKNRGVRIRSRGRRGLTKDGMGILPFCPFPPCDNPDVQPASWWTPRQHCHPSH